MGAVISTGNLLEEPGSAISASGSAGALGVGNLLTPRIAEVWRCQDTGEIVLRGVLAGVREAGLFLLASPRDGLLCEAHARFRLTCSAVAVDGTDLLDTGDVCGAMPSGIWAWPIGLRVAPQRVWNPCLAEAADGWTPGGAKVPALAPAVGRWRLPVDGSGIMSATGPLPPGGGAMEAAFIAADISDREPPVALNLDWRGGVFPSGGTITRAHTPATAVATRVNALGVIEEVGANVPRINYSAVTKQVLGYLHEQATTNVLSAPRDFDNAVWGKARTNVTANAGSAPNGLMQADRIIPSEVSGNHSIATETNLSYVAGTSYTFSIFARAIGTAYPWLMVAFPAAAFSTTSRVASVNLITGLVGSTHAGVTVRMEQFGDMWRVQVTALCTITASAATAVTLYTSTISATAAPTFVGNLTDGHEYWGAQLEARGYATSLVMLPAGTIGTAQRADDTAYWNFAAISRQTVYVERRIEAGSAGREAPQLNAGSSTSHRLVAGLARAGSSFVSYGRMRSAADYTASVTGTVPLPLAAPFRTAVSMAQDNFISAAEGRIEGTDSSVNAQSLTRIVFEPADAVVHYREVRVYPQAMAPAELAVLTRSGLVRGDEPWEAQVAMLPKGCQGVPVLRWLAFDGSVLAESVGEVVPPSTAQDGRKLARYKVARVSAVPPANARSVAAVVRGLASADNPLDPFLVFSRVALSRGVGAHWNRAFLRLPGDTPGAEMVQFFTLRINSTRDYVQAGRLFLAPALFTDRNPEYGMTDSMQDGGTNERSGVSAIRFGQRGRSYATRNMRVSSMWPDEAAVARGMLARAGKTDQFFISPMIERMNDQGLLGAVASMNFNEASFQTVAMDAAIEEDC
jgi:hypothetical protein